MVTTNIRGVHETGVSENLAFQKINGLITHSDSKPKNHLRSERQELSIPRLIFITLDPAQGSE